MKFGKKSTGDFVVIEIITRSRSNKGGCWVEEPFTTDFGKTS